VCVYGYVVMPEHVHLLSGWDVQASHGVQRLVDGSRHNPCLANPARPFDYAQGRLWATGP